MGSGQNCFLSQLFKEMLCLGEGIGRQGGCCGGGEVVEVGNLGEDV